MWIKRQVFCLLLLLSCLSPVFSLEPLSEKPEDPQMKLLEIFNQLEAELLILRLQSANETKQYQILEKQRIDDQNTIASLMSQSEKDSVSLTRLEESQRKDRDRLIALETSLKEAGQSLKDEALRMQSEKFKVGIIGTAAGVVAGAAVVGILWYFKTN